MFITSCKLNTCFVTLPAEKFCLKTKSLFYRPGFIDLLGNQVEVVTEFKLLGVTIDEKLTFESHVKLLRAKVTQKLFAIKKYSIYHTVSNYIFLKHLFFRTLITVLHYLYIFLIPYLKI